MPATDTTHECPAPGCTKRVPHQYLACGTDWRRLPEPLRKAVNVAYRHGTATAHLAAIAAAVDWYRRNA